MNDLLKAVVVMTITGSVLALAMFALKPFVKNRLPKAAQYYLWLVVLAALLVPFSRFVTLPAQYPALSDTVSYYLPTQEELFNRVKPYETELPSGFIGVPEADMPTVETLAPSTLTQELLDWCRLIYPLGAMFVFGYFVITYLAFCERLKRRNVLTDIKAAIPVYRNPLASTPMLIGFFQPSIVLPDRDYTDEQLNAVVAHELTHHRRKDVLVRWLTVAACAVHWFNPLVWLMRREIDRACELSCDEAVIRNLDVSGKQNYGDTLLYVAADAKATRSALAMCEEKRDLKERLGAIMKSKKRGVVALCVSAALLVTLAACAIALGAGSGKNLPEFETIVTELSEYGREIQFRNGDTLYSSYYGYEDGAKIERGTKIGWAKRVDPHSGDFTIYERKGYPAYEFIVVYDSTLMNGDSIYAGQASPIATPLTSDISALAELRTPYVGNNSAVGKIVYALPPLGDRHTQKFFSIGDDYGFGNVPYTLTVYYEQEGTINDEYAITPHNAVLLLALIDNLEEVSYAVRTSPSGDMLDKSAYHDRVTYNRADLGEYLATVGLTWEDFLEDWSASVDKAFALIGDGQMAGAREWSPENRRQMTLADVRAISQKLGEDLTLNDLSDFIGEESGSGLRYMQYEVDGGEYGTLSLSVVAGGDMAAPVMAADLSRGIDYNSACDIRRCDVDAFLSAGELKPIVRNAVPMQPATYIGRDYADLAPWAGNWYLDGDELSGRYIELFADGTFVSHYPGEDGNFGGEFWTETGYGTTDGAGVLLNGTVVMLDDSYMVVGFYAEGDDTLILEPTGRRFRFVRTAPTSGIFDIGFGAEDGLKYPDSTITAYLANLGDIDVYCGEPFTIERQTGSEWVTVPFIDNFGFDLPLYTLTKDSDSQSYVLRPEYLAKPLTPGWYRFVTKISIGNVADTGNWQTSAVYAAFYISDKASATNSRRQLTLDDVRRLDTRGGNLAAADFETFAHTYSANELKKIEEYHYLVDGGKWEVDVTVDHIDGEGDIVDVSLIPIGFEFKIGNSVWLGKGEAAEYIKYIENFTPALLELTPQEEAAALEAVRSYYAGLEFSKGKSLDIARVTDFRQYAGLVIADRAKGKLAAFTVVIKDGGKPERSIVLTQTESGGWEVINEGY